jgi:hypothetical protein
MQVNQILSEIDSEIARLQQARNILAGSSGGRGRPRGTSATSKPAKKRGGKRKLSPEGRKRISDALKARWAERKKRAAGKTSK